MMPGIRYFIEWMLMLLVMSDDDEQDEKDAKMDERESEGG